MFRQHIRQPQHQLLKVEGYVRVCGNGEFWIFPLLQLSLQDNSCLQPVQLLKLTSLSCSLIKPVPELFS